MSGDLHRHDEFSTYDGTGNALQLAKIAKEKGHTFLGLSNHGNTSGNVLHYDACKSVGIKPIMGVEGYFLPKHIEQQRGFHLCLFAKDVEGYKNINLIQSLADRQRYYNPIIDFKMLEEHHDGIICTSACVAGFIPQCIIKGNLKQARHAIKKFVSIFGDDFYLEVQPYAVSDEGMQETVNIHLIKLAKELHVKCIMTSDSHRGRKEDLDVYLKMHELKNASAEYLEHVKKTYADRYMPDKGELEKRFIKMHKGDFGESEAKKLAKWMAKNLDEIEAKVSDTIIDDIAAMPAIPKFDESKDSFKLLVSNVKSGLKKRGVYNKQYINRVKEELYVIKQNNFEDYFLIVQDYVMWARNNGIGVGPGRGSGCNCLVNFALGITDVDPLIFKLDFRRFIREGKKTLPDIDVDFETERRAEVQRYVVQRYPGHAVQIASYGTYKVDNLVNDLAKTYDGLFEDKNELKQIKQIINSHLDEEKQVNVDELVNDSQAKYINKLYKGFFDAFKFMFNKVKYIGTHAAGVAISKKSIYYYTAVKYDAKNDKYFSAYNLVDLERCGIVKYDLLGLSTLSSIVEMRERIGQEGFDVNLVNDKNVINAFAEGKSNGIFQYSATAAQQILRDIHTDSFNDVVAASAMNRPGPLSQGIPSMYAESKLTWEKQSDKPPYSDIVDDTYGCILYQEQVNAIAVGFGGLSWNEADKLRKMDDPASLKSRMLIEQYYEPFVKKFTKGMKRYGFDADESKELFDKFLNYTFNKGHAVGYGLISAEEMFYKVYYPAIFWYTKMKHVNMERDGYRFMSECVKDGNVIFLPHVNYSEADFSLRKVDGEEVVQMGLSSLKGVGEKAAQYIYEERLANGIFTSFDNFYDRCKSRLVTSRVVSILKEEGAAEFRKSVYINRVTKFNTQLYASADD